MGWKINGWFNDNGGGIVLTLLDCDLIEPTLILRFCCGISFNGFGKKSGAIEDLLELTEELLLELIKFISKVVEMELFLEFTLLNSKGL